MSKPAIGQPARRSPSPLSATALDHCGTTHRSASASSYSIGVSTAPCARVPLRPWSNRCQPSASAALSRLLSAWIRGTGHSRASRTGVWGHYRWATASASQALEIRGSTSLVVSTIRGPTSSPSPGFSWYARTVRCTGLSSSPCRSPDPIGKTCSRPWTSSRSTITHPVARQRDRPQPAPGRSTTGWAPLAQRR